MEREKIASALRDPRYWVGVAQRTLLLWLLVLVAPLSFRIAEANAKAASLCPTSYGPPGTALPCYLPQLWAEPPAWAVGLIAFLFVVQVGLKLRERRAAKERERARRMATHG